MSLSGHKEWELKEEMRRNRSISLAEIWDQIRISKQKPKEVTLQIAQKRPLCRTVISGAEEAASVRLRFWNSTTSYQGPPALCASPLSLSSGVRHQAGTGWLSAAVPVKRRRFWL